MKQKNSKKVADFSVMDKVTAKWRDGSTRMCSGIGSIKEMINRSLDKAEVIDVRFSQEKDSFEYYIHYAGCKSQL